MRPPRRCHEMDCENDAVKNRPYCTKHLNERKVSNHSATKGWPRYVFDRDKVIGDDRSLNYTDFPVILNLHSMGGE
jgi:hypothetical protein